jgi:hypothetical protein
VLYNIARKAEISVPDGGDENDNNDCFASGHRKIGRFFMDN